VNDILAIVRIILPALAVFSTPVYGQTIEGFFPGRDVVVVETLELWYRGGGVHCVTNDQPSRIP